MCSSYVGKDCLDSSTENEHREEIEKGIQNVTKKQIEREKWSRNLHNSKGDGVVILCHDKTSVFCKVNVNKLTSHGFGLGYRLSPVAFPHLPSVVWLCRERCEGTIRPTRAEEEEEVKKRGGGRRRKHKAEKKSVKMEKCEKWSKGRIQPLTILH